MKAGARNQLKGPVTEIKRGDVMAEIKPVVPAGTIATETLEDDSSVSSFSAPPPSQRVSRRPSHQEPSTPAEIVDRRRARAARSAPAEEWQRKLAGRAYADSAEVIREDRER